MKDPKFLKEAVKKSSNAKKELFRDKDFLREIEQEVHIQGIAPTYTPEEPCPSGICELPPKIEAGEPKDFSPKSQFPNCLCKKCGHYEKCGGLF